MGEGSSSATEIDFSGATNALKDMSEALKDWVSAAVPYIVGIAAAFFAFYLVRVVIRLVRSASK